MSVPSDLPGLLRHLALVARGRVADRGERWAAALEAEAAAKLVEQLMSTSDEAARALQELADGHQGPDDQQIVSQMLIERLRQLIRASGGASD